MSRTITDASDARRALGDLERLAAAFSKAAADLVPGDGTPLVTFESPRNPAFGDFATNVALQLAKQARRAPQVLASELVEKVFADDATLRDIVAEATPVGGFINVRLAPAFWQRVVARILREGKNYGRRPATGERVTVEAPLPGELQKWLRAII